MKAKDEVLRLLEKLIDGSLPPDEPLFCLRAQDRLAAGCVRAWVDACDKSDGVPQAKTTEALLLARDMDTWPVKQTPGKPETKRDRLCPATKKPPE